MKMYRLTNGCLLAVTHTKSGKLGQVTRVALQITGPGLFLEILQGHLGAAVDMRETLPIGAEDINRGGPEQLFRCYYCCLGDAILYIKTALVI